MNNELDIAIYAVDDDETQRYVLNQLFEKKGIRNYEIFSSPEAVLESLHRGVQICVLDYELRSTMNGFELMKVIIERNSYCKCIIVSAHRDFEMVKDFLNCGAFRYIEKGEQDYGNRLVSYIKEAIKIVKGTFDFYTTLRARSNETKELLKEYRDGRTNH